MATLAVQYLTKAGLVPVTFNAVAAGGDEFRNDGAVTVIMRNAHAADPRTVTFVAQKTVDGGLVVGNRAVTITAAQDFAAIKLDPTYFNDSDGMVQMTYSDSGADLSIALIA